ncbi:major facilitator superfamily domain-containing protein [Aspergillus undulatus]|uniref:major facilitator superfamily domain-containing protein n=1 Tax=Aspergillus undulatus TaxID=1810928 RepID=UPI003CCCADE1
MAPSTTKSSSPAQRRRPATTQGLEKKKSDPRELALVRKLDGWIMPILWFMYFLNYLARFTLCPFSDDRNAIALARLNNLEKDLNLSSHGYQTCVSIRWWMSSCMAVWAIISALTALSQTYFCLLMTRFFFGNILATAFAGLIALGIFQMDGMAGISGWRWLFIIQSVVTFIIAILGFFILPDEPLTTRWLTEAENLLAHNRIQEDTVGNEGQAASTWQVWLFTLVQHCHLGANGFKNFFPTAVEMLGFNETITLVLTCPPYLVAGFISIAWSWSSGRFNERTWHITIAKAVAVFGFVLGCATLNTGARYFAMCVFSIGTYAVNSIILGWKKASSLAIVNCIAVASFIWAPYMWPSGDEPRYVMAMSSSAALSIATATGAWAMGFWLKHENKRIRQLENEAVVYYAY